MTDRELKGLSRAELLQMLIELSRENEQLEDEAAQLRAKLNERRLKIEKAGSIAEASLALNGVFEAAEAAAAQYLDNMAQCEARCQAKQRDAEKGAEEILSIARETAGKIVEEAQYNARKMTEDAKVQSELYWKNAYQRIEGFYDDFKGLKEFLSTDPKVK